MATSLTSSFARIPSVSKHKSAKRAKTRISDGRKGNARRKLLVERLEQRELLTATLGFVHPVENPEGRCLWQGWALPAEGEAIDVIARVPSSIAAPPIIAPALAFAPVDGDTENNGTGGTGLPTPVIDDQPESPPTDQASGSLGFSGGPSIVGAPNDWQTLSPARTVKQWIEGEFHVWDEYDVAGTNQFFIVLNRPEQKALGADEASRLMVRSASWLYFDPDSLDPSQQTVVDASELAKLQPDQPHYISWPEFGGARTVLGDDDRVRVPLSQTQVAPRFNVGFQSNTYPTNESFRCTAFAVTPHVALTNGHCVFNSGRGGYVTSARFTPGQFQASTGATVQRPLGGPFSAVAWETNPSYVTDPADAFAHDYAAMFFNDSFTAIGMNTFVPLVFNAVPTTVEIIGYPGTAQGEPTQTMWTSSGAATVRATDNRILTYLADSSGGNSGGPIWEWVNGNPRVVGVHAFGSTNHNGGPRLSDHNRDIINQWLLWTPEPADIGDTLNTAEATSLGPASGVYSNTSRLGNGSHGTRDVDIFRLTATAGSSLIIETSSVAGGQAVDTVLRLFDSAGTQLALNNNSSGLYSRIEFPVTADGTYYVGVSGHPNENYTPLLGGSGVAGSTGDYNLSITLATPPPQDFALVGVDFGPAGSSRPLNWTLYSGGSAFTSFNNLIDETGSVTPFDLSIRTLNSSSLFFSGNASPPSNQLPSHSQSLAAIAGNVYSTFDAEFLWSDLVPGDTYEVYVFGSDTDAFSTDFIVYGHGHPHTFNQTGSANSLRINGHAGDSSRALETFAIVAVADPMGQIRIESRKVGSIASFAGVAIRPGQPLPPPGGISGFKWNDLNGNAIWESGEPGLANWTIYLDINNNGQWDQDEPTTETANDGSYRFAGLSPGIYRVAELMQDDWVQTFPSIASAPQSTVSSVDIVRDDQAEESVHDPLAAETRLAQLAELVADHPNYQVFPTGQVVATNPNIYSVSEDDSETTESDPRFPLNQTFLLHSLPGATKTIYLDFDGHTTNNTFWNSQFNSNQPIVTPAYSLDSDPAFSNAELTQIQQIWEIISEDFRPFNVNVTTEDPGTAALINSGSGDQRWGIRVVFGENTGWYAPAGGVAYINSFNWNSDTPTFVFNRGLIGAAEAGSHEVGHTLGLLHDGRGGTSPLEYYEGHGSGATGWAPIMGVGYYRQLVQWSRGEYPDANRTEDDLQIIVANNGFGYRVDDHGSTLANASVLNTSPSSTLGFVDVADDGIVERNTDVDFFVFTTGAGTVTLNITPFHRSPNLDILARLYDSSGSVIATSNPVNALNASFQLALSAGTYYLSIEGTGKPANGPDFGYSDYGSLGFYSITGTLREATIPGTHLVFVGEQVVPGINFGNRFDGILPGEIHGFKWHDLNQDGVWDSNEPALQGWTIYIDENENGELDDTEPFVLTDATGKYSFTGLMPAVYFIGEVMQDGWAQTFPNVLPPMNSTIFAAGNLNAAGDELSLQSQQSSASVSDSQSNPSRNAESIFTAVPRGQTATSSIGVDETTLVATTATVPVNVGLNARNTNPITMAVSRAANLSQYSAEQLSESLQWVVMVEPGQSPREAARGVGGRLVSEVSLIPNAFVIEMDAGYDHEAVSESWGESSSVSAFFPLVARRQHSRLIPNDPLFANQWHLRNTGQSGGTVGMDARITSVWDNYLGDGVVIAIVDDGLEHTHPDLITRYIASLSYDFNGNDTDPMPMTSSDNHGTAVAGVAAATANNAVGVSGAAPNASLAGVRLIAGAVTDLMEAQALTLFGQDIHIYNNSWGPQDSGVITSQSRPGPLTLAALQAGATDGRGGLGSIYVWAGGNGGLSNDNVNYDGYANSRFTLAVGAIDNRGRQSAYSEPGAPLIVSAFSSGGAASITTTTLVASGSYTNSFGGTSSSAPLVAGVIALMLEANPNLSYRDVKQILIDSARQNDPADSDWVTNGAGRLVNHKFGFGAIDAQAAVTLAEGWTNLGPEVMASSGVINVGQPLPDNNPTGLSSSFTFDAEIDVEYVEVVFDATHTYRGDLRVVLTSPDGTQSVLAEPRVDNGANYSNWVFTSARHWGEAAAGQWTLSVQDLFNLDLGTWNHWQINLYGTSNAPTRPGFHRVEMTSGLVVNDLNFGNRTVDLAPPLVTNVLVGSSQWTPAFVNHIAPGAVGVTVTADDIVPWGLVDRLYVQFNEPVEGFAQSNIDLRGVNVPDYNPLISNVSFDPASFLGTIQLSESIGRDRIRLSVSPNVTDIAGNSLDGGSTGTGGNPFTRVFGLLPGDATQNGSVNGSDLVIFSGSFNRSIGSPTYDALADWNGSGSVNGADLVFFSTNFNRSLPSNQPTGPSFTTPTMPPDAETLFVVPESGPTGSPDFDRQIDDRDAIELDALQTNRFLVAVPQKVSTNPPVAFHSSRHPQPDESRSQDVQDAVFGDLNAQWDEPADRVGLLEA